MRIPDPTSELALFFNEDPPAWARAYESFVQRVLERLEVPGYDFSITFCTDQRIRELNRDWRHKDEATDVLSFEADGVPGQEDWVLGDLVISLETLKTNSAYFEVGEEEELKRLTIHGILHLMGWDHTDNSPQQPMLRYQEEILGHYGKEDWF